MKYISLLRGINVGGSKPLHMKDLRTLMSNLGMTEVQTYIQSGNLVYNSNLENASDISGIIENAIEQRFNYLVPVVTIAVDEFLRIIERNPYIGSIENNRLHLSFLEKIPKSTDLESIQELDTSPESFSISNNFIYIACETKFSSKSKLTNTFFESKLKVRTTTRNWRTILKLKELAIKI